MRKTFHLEIDSSRIYGLDLLRAVAICDVVIQHGTYLLPRRWAAAVGLFGVDGVSMFFVLSGFLIGGILIKSVEQHPVTGSLLVNFWIRRWFRTLPAYFVVLIAVCCLNVLFTPGFSLASTKRYFVFAQNLWRAHPHFFPEAWSLSIEEWFYLLVPLLLVTLIRGGRVSPRVAIFTTAVVILLAATGIRLYRHAVIDVKSLSDWDSLFRKQVVTRLDSLMFGVIGAAIRHYHNRFWLACMTPAFWSGLGIMGLLKTASLTSAFPVGGVFFDVFIFSVAASGTLLLLPWLSEYRGGKGVMRGAVTFISLISYSMYLLNLTVVQVWILGGGRFPVVEAKSPLFLVLLQVAYHVNVLVLSLLLYKYVELPMMRLRDHPKLLAMLRVQ